MHQNPLARKTQLLSWKEEGGSKHWCLSELPEMLNTSNLPSFCFLHTSSFFVVCFCSFFFLNCFLVFTVSLKRCINKQRGSFLLLFAGFQPVPVWQCAHASQCFPQKTGGQEMAQHGKSELHEEIHQTLERRPIHAWDY